jgi:RNA polymerase sigma-70 factor (ECF subfamily)
VDDQRLLARMRRGDEQALAELFGRHRLAVHRYAVHMCGATNADDVVQETFLALIHQLDRFDPERGTVRSYLLGIARRQAARRFAGPIEAALEEDSSSTPNASGDDPLADLTRAEAIAAVRAAIATLPANYREAVVLCELNEMDYAEAAAAIGCPIGTVRSRLHRARAILVRKLALHGSFTIAKGVCRS